MSFLQVALLTEWAFGKTLRIKFQVAGILYLILFKPYEVLTFGRTILCSVAPLVLELVSCNVSTNCTEPLRGIGKLSLSELWAKMKFSSFIWSDNFKILKLLYNGVVSSRKLAKLIILIALFCIFVSQVFGKPQNGAWHKKENLCP